MVIVQGRSFVVNGVEARGTVTVTVNFSSVTTPVVAFAPMKYNKRAGMLLVKDDGTKDDYNKVFAYLTGGRPIEGGSQSAGVRYTDGCGNPVEYHYTFAINKGHGRDGSQPSYDNIETSWAEYNEMIEHGYGIANHSLDHGGTSNYLQVKELEKIVYEKTGQRTRTFVIPTADEGYAETAPYLGYKMVGSAFGADSSDDNNVSGNQNIVWGSRINVSLINEQRLNKFLSSRWYCDNFGDSGHVQGLKDQFDGVLADSTGNTYFMGHMFSHGVGNPNGSLDGFIEYIQYIQNHPNNNDSIWLPTMQEFVEYYETKLLVNKSQNLVGNTMTIELDLAELPSEGLWQDMSLVITGGSIASVDVTGADDFSYNSSTGLINLFKKNQSVKSPQTDIDPPQIISASRSGNSVVITYDSPVTQTVFSNSNGDAYSVSNNTVTNVSGYGSVWTLECQNTVTTGQTLTYRMQRGNASSGGRKVCSYIRLPIA